MDFLSADVFSLALTIIAVVVVPLLAALLKRKWGIEIDTAALQAELAKVEIGKVRQTDLHSAIKTGVAQVLDQIEATANTIPTGAFPAKAPALKIPPTARRVIVEHLQKSIPGTLAALSPMPDVIDNLAIRFATELLAQRRAR